MNRNGTILWQDRNTVVILTGLKRPSRNKATGAMLQVFILYKHKHPVLAARGGLDKHVCGNCPRRPYLVKLKKDRGLDTPRKCYVELAKSVGAVWECFKRGSYPVWDKDTTPFEGKLIRWGAYGGPEKIPVGIVREISEASAGWTGYTHQWQNPAADKYREFFMASTESEAEHRKAKELGWMSFRALREGERLVRGEEMCMKSKEHEEACGFTLDCSSCLKCNGRSGDVGIKEHN